ncbi:MAG TPA: glycosyltransferase family 2 protein [Terriglobales bacterium]|nr:glycosyltransferase family 2 protein [Terriglobales bacterium]
MEPTQDISKTEPILSVVIPVYNGWKLLDGCLASLSREKELPFEVIVVDDGSRESYPEKIRQWNEHFPLQILRQEHKGVSAARNKGIQACKAPLILFIDADSRVQANCLSNLMAAVTQFPEDSFFQVRLIGNPATITGKAEQLRLAALQKHLVQSDGHIRYANTAGFAVRRLSLDARTPLFNPKAPRGEDTLFLANLIRQGSLPLFLPEATIQHLVPRSLLKCFRKDLSSGYLQSAAYARIAAAGVTVRMTNRERLQMLIALWGMAKSYSGGKTAWTVLLIRQSLERTTSFLCRWFGISPKTMLDARRAD